MTNTGSQFLILSDNLSFNCYFRWFTCKVVIAVVGLVSAVFVWLCSACCIGSVSFFHFFFCGFKWTCYIVPFCLLFSTYLLYKGFSPGPRAYKWSHLLKNKTKQQNKTPKTKHVCVCAQKATCKDTRQDTESLPLSDRVIGDFYFLFYSFLYCLNF